jgi:hypothetical protein
MEKRLKKIVEATLQVLSQDLAECLRKITEICSRVTCLGAEISSCSPDSDSRWDTSKGTSCYDTSLSVLQGQSNVTSA